MSNLLTKAYSCGAKIHYLPSDSGKSFTCHRCGKQHFYPEKVGSRRPKTETPPTPTPTPTQEKDGLGTKVLQLWEQLFPSQEKSPQRNVSGAINSSDAALPTELKSLKNDLIRQTWHRTGGPADLVLPPARLAPPAWSQCLNRMLRHAEQVAPKLSIPLLVPQLSFQDELLHTAGGTFRVEGDGSVLITVKRSLEQQPRVALAVLAHELCHYILGTNNIRKEDTLLNEKMTDVCMFVLGFGKIFLDGHQAISGSSYGYLRRNQYRALLTNTTANWLIRGTLTDVDSEVDELERWAIGAIGQGDRSRYEYAFKRMKAKYPHFTKRQILGKMKYDFMR